MEVHGKANGVNFRYVWAKLKDNYDMKYHIARQYEGDYLNTSSVSGRTIFVCSHYQNILRNADVKVVEWYPYEEKDKLKYIQNPSYYASCLFCWNIRQKFQKAIDGSKTTVVPGKNETEVHGKMYNVNFRYVWARPKDNFKLKFHIARLYEGTYDGYKSMHGVASFLCSHYGGSWKSTNVDIRELADPPVWASRCEFCYNNKADYQAKVNKYWLETHTEETLKQAVHGKMLGVAFRYVWARPMDKVQMKYHIARVFEGEYEGFGNNVKGTTSFLCSHFQGKWATEKVNILEWGNLPGYHNRCDRCSGQLEKFEGFVYKALDKESIQEQVEQAMEGHMKEHTTKPDEEDIGVETEYYACQECQSNTCKCSEEEMVKRCLRSNVGTGGRENILPPYSECLRCKRRYAINVGTYKPLDGTGIRLRTYNDHAETGMFVHMYLCVCDRPILIMTTTQAGTWSKVNIGRPVLR